MTTRDINKELMYSDYLVTEHPHIRLRFIPGGILHVFGEDKAAIIHRYNIIHNGENFVMNTAPYIMDTPGTMTMIMMKNHLTLLSEKVDSDGKPIEVLHLNKGVLKAYDSSK